VRFRGNQGAIAGVREQKPDHAARHQLRQQEAAPQLKMLQIEITAALHQALPASALGKASNYTLALWHHPVPGFRRQKRVGNR